MQPSATRRYPEYCGASSHVADAHAVQPPIRTHIHRPCPKQNHCVREFNQQHHSSVASTATQSTCLPAQHSRPYQQHQNLPTNSTEPNPTDDPRRLMTQTPGAGASLAAAPACVRIASHAAQPPAHHDQACLGLSVMPPSAHAFLLPFLPPTCWKPSLAAGAAAAAAAEAGRGAACPLEAGALQGTTAETAQCDNGRLAKVGLCPKTVTLNMGNQLT